jgi:hypothetical protein
MLKCTLHSMQQTTLAAVYPCSKLQLAETAQLAPLHAQQAPHPINITHIHSSRSFSTVQEQHATVGVAAAAATATVATATAIATTANVSSLLLPLLAHERVRCAAELACCSLPLFHPQ